MSQSPRKPQSKWRSPQEGLSGPPKADAPPASAPAPAQVSPVPAAAPAGPAVAPSPRTAVPPPPASAPSLSTPVAPLPAVAPVAGPPLPAVVPDADPAPSTADVAPSAASLTPAGEAPAGEADSLSGGSAVDDELALPLTLRDRLRRLSPAYVTLTVVSIGSVLFLALAVTSHTTPVAVLMSAAVVTSLAFALDIVICTTISYEASRRENIGRAVLFALLGGVSALICALSTAGTLILVLVLTG